MTDVRPTEAHEASFRDPCGFLFVRDGVLYRQVNHAYKDHFEHLINSGLYQELVNAELLIPHEEVELSPVTGEHVFKVLKPEPLFFISYPYEWCFSQLKDCALTTLRVQKLALEKNMCLKDASAYNVQFRHGKPILIDTLSFERYQSGEPWVAYRQLCQHFLAPLTLMGYVDVRLGKLLQNYIDGIPLDLVSRLLPRRTYLKPSLLLHIHMHARSQKRYADKAMSRHKSGRGVSKHSMLGLVDSLKSTINKLKWKYPRTEWADYYESASYSDEALDHKKELVDRFIGCTEARVVWDFGANVGLFSSISAKRGLPTISFDTDPVAVEKNYLRAVEGNEKLLQPLLLDLTCPSPSIGWMNRERVGLLDRGPVDLAMVLALIHHLAISNNLPLRKIAEFFAPICRWLIIEFIPKTDSQVKRLLATREDIFVNYTQQAFEDEFGRLFRIVASEPIKGTERTLYLMQQANAEWNRPKTQKEFEYA